MLHANTLMLAYTHVPRFGALHAGAVVRDGRCVLLSAASGSGKSTLTAALAAAGYDYLTDGKRIRYLPMPCSLHRDDTVPVTALIFSQYRPRVATAVRSVRPAEALLRLSTAGYDTELSEQTVRALIEWLCTVPSYELVYGELDGAVAAIDEITQ